MGYTKEGFQIGHFSHWESSSHSPHNRNYFSDNILQIMHLISSTILSKSRINTGQAHKLDVTAFIIHFLTYLSKLYDSIPLKYLKSLMVKLFLSIILILSGSSIKVSGVAPLYVISLNGF